MPNILLFVEDSAQEKFLSTLLKRLANENSMRLTIRVRTARGGAGRLLTELKGFVREAQSSAVSLPDGMVVAIDANCRGYLARRDEVKKAAGTFSDLIVYAVPDPHIERWLLVDSEAFKTAVGTGCKAPDEKCEKLRYKRLLNEAVWAAGVQPLLGGVEYAEDIANAIDIQRSASADDSFDKLISEFRSWMNRIRLRG